MNIPEKGFYQHYKHDPANPLTYNYQYEVLGTVRHSETHELLVLYRPLYERNNTDWLAPATAIVRPLTAFTETIIHPDTGIPIPRFMQITDPRT